MARVFLGGDELLDTGIVFDLGSSPQPSEPTEPEPTDDAIDGEPADGDTAESDENTDAPPADEGVQAPTEVQSGEPEAEDTEG